MTKADVDWGDLRYVLETVRHKGLSGAARALGVNHATVARRIAAAEHALGTALFERRPSGYVPTSAGEDAARTAEAFETAQASLSRSIAARDNALRGPLTVTAPHLLIQTFLGPILRDFSAAHPEIELTVLGSISTLNLAEREADVAIRISDTPDPDLVGRQVAAQQSAVFASHDYAKALAEDPDHRLYWLRFLNWQPVPKAVRDVYPNVTTVMALDDMVAMLGVVRSGAGATRIPCFLGDLDPDLTRIPGLPLFPYPAIWVLTNEDLRRVPRITAFTGFVSQAMRAQRSAFEGASSA